MPVAPRDYFRYFAGGPELRRWGLGLTAAGWTHVPAGSPYPPGRHPADHQFEWSRGRVLDALQIVFVASGRGSFESKPTGLRAIEPGTAFAVVPNTWHRYRPDPATGWTESWLEVQGPTVNALLRGGVLPAQDAVRVIAPAARLEEALEALHVRARSAGAGFDPELAAAALAVLAGWEKAARLQPTRSRIDAAITEAEHQLAERLAEPVNVAALSRQLGIAYSHFRREFKVRTGFSPWQYVLHLRLARARRLLASSDLTLEELAARLGFSSAFHLSTAFKRAYGVAPDHWRRKLGASG